VCHFPQLKFHHLIGIGRRSWFIESAQLHVDHTLSELTCIIELTANVFGYLPRSLGKGVFPGYDIVDGRLEL
jgi:hypothetical protein